ncbi:MAG: oligosaccharide flippase family protein, partial [Mucinivorans sp.]
YMSFHPENLISGLSDPTQREIAHKLLLILAISAPVMVLQRMLQMIFGIRLEEYNIQKIVIIGNVLKIASIFYFFTGGRYDIVGYYLFMQIVAVMVVLTGLWMARRKYNYPFKLLFTKFKFSKTIFAQTKSLAFSSLFVTAAWILYYELDSIAIGKMLGAKMVAIYAIGLTLLGFIRSLLGVFFSPFSSRFNHFIGLGKIEEFKTFYLHVIKMTFPLVVFPLTAAAMMSRGLIVSWVGVEYDASVDVAVWLILCNVLGFISYPAGVMLVAREKIKQMYLVNAAMVVVFWGGILLTIGSWGVESFAVFKFITFTLSAILYVWLSIQFLGISFAKFLRQVVLPHLPALILIIVVLYFVQNICIDGKSKLSLLINASIVVGAICVGFC